MPKEANIKPNRKEYGGPGYYMNCETERRESGKGARVKFKAVRRMVECSPRT